MSQRINSQLAAASILPFMLFLVSPLAFYSGNRNEIHFQLPDIAFPVLVVFGGFSLGLFLILLALRKFPKAHSMASGILAGAAAAVWIQSQVFLWNFGVFDGRAILWTRWSSHMWLEAIVWTLAIAAFIYLFFRHKTRRKTSLQLLFLLGTLSIALNYLIASPRLSKPVFAPEEGYRYALYFHPVNNVIVILLDTFQSDYFDLVREKHPKDIAFLDGFTFYRNFMSQYPTTEPNVLSLMTGKVYNNLEALDAFRQSAFSKFNLFQAYASRGYRSQEIEPAGMEKVLQKHSFSGSAPWREFLDYGLFRGAPTFCKRYIHNNANWFLSFWGRGTYPPELHGNDIRFLELFERKAEIVSGDKAGVFTFFRFFLPHPPWRVDENLQYNPELAGRDGYIRQIRGALALAGRMVNKMKALGIYHSSEIVILADHGTQGPTSVPVNAATSANYDLPSNVHSSALALFLHKKPFSRGKLTVNDAPLINSDLACLLGVNNDSSNCTDYESALKGMPRKRRFLYYDLSDNEAMRKNYMPKMTEYFVNGHAHDAASWRPGEYQYEAGQKIPRIDTSAYKLGSPVRFISGGNSDRYVRGGWGQQEPRHRWTEGNQAGLSFRPEGKIVQDLELRLLASAYLAQGKIDHQLIKVVVNSQEISRWTVRGEEWLEATIPASLIQNDNLLHIVFDISSPAAPANLGESGDRRMLGMMVKELVLALKH